MEKDSIDKIDEQINNILNEEKEIHKKEEIVKEEEIVPSDDDTKKIDKIEDLSKEETVEEVKEEPVEEVKEEVIEEKVEETPVVEEKKEEKKEEPVKKNDNNFYLYLILGVVAVFVLFFLVFFIVSRSVEKEKKKEEETFTAAEQQEIVEEYGSAIQQIVKIYLDQKQQLLTYEEAEELVGFEYDVVCTTHEIYEDGEIYLNDCSINQIKTKYSYGNKKAEEETPVINNEALHVFVSKKDKKAKLKEPTNLKEYDIYEFTIDEPYSSLRLLGEKDPSYVYYKTTSNVNTVVVYDFKKKEKIFGGKYCSVYPIKIGNSYDMEYVVVRNGCNSYEDAYSMGVANISSGNLTLPMEYALMYNKVQMEVAALDQGIMIGTKVVVPFVKYGLINYRTGKEIVPVTYSSPSPTIYGKKILFQGEDYKHFFDFSGKELLTNYNIYDAKGEYMLVKDKKEIKLVNQNGKEIHNFGETWEEGLEYKYCANVQDEVFFKFQSGNNDENCIEYRYNIKEDIGSVSNTNCGGF